MAAPRKLKVFRTAIGFHDAYVAAPSKKAALAAWGAKTDLFAVGAAELVTDPALTREALDRPGEVIRASRGSLSAHLQEAAKAVKRQKQARSPSSSGKAAEKRGREAAPAAPPSRRRLNDAETALARFEAQATAELAELRDRERELARVRKAAEARLEKERARLEQRLASARERHESAVERWRDLP